ncbi:MAG: C-GCAxxG-C-C family protein [Dehalococcoidia bacterium]
MERQLSRDEILDLVEESAYRYEKAYHGCAQCVLRAIQDHLRVDNGATFRSASALAGGVALMGDSCGALIAGMMALGLVFGRQNIEDFPTLASSFVPARALYARFRQEFGSCLCREVMASQLGRFYDLATEYDQFQAAGGYERCSRVASKTARMAAELILAAHE